MLKLFRPTVTDGKASPSAPLSPARQKLTEAQAAVAAQREVIGQLRRTLDALTDAQRSEREATEALEAVASAEAIDWQIFLRSRAVTVPAPRSQEREAAVARLDTSRAQVIALSLAWEAMAPENQAAHQLHGQLVENMQAAHAAVLVEEATRILALARAHARQVQILDQAARALQDSLLVAGRGAEASAVVREMGVVDPFEVRGAMKVTRIVWRELAERLSHDPAATIELEGETA